MKILIATDSMGIGGAETHVFTLINELKKKHAVTLISSGGVFSKTLEKSGIRCVYAPFDKRDALSILKSKKALKEEMDRVAIVHTHTRFTSFLAKSIRGKSSYPKIITTAHLNFSLFPFGAFAFWGDTTLAVSEDIRTYLEDKYNIKRENIKLTKNSIDTAIYKKSPLNKKLIIHTSRIDKGRAKTAFLLVSVAEKILSHNNDWRIMIVGDGNLFTKLSKKAKEKNALLGFEGIILTGARSDIPSLLRYASIFIGVSRSAIEGMASGLPTIICGDEGYGGIVENANFDLLSRTNFCARRLPQATEELLLRDIENLISDKHKREFLGTSARKMIENSYQAKSMANDAQEAYASVLKPPSVCLMGFFGYSNIGDETMLECAISALKNNGIYDISVLCSRHFSYADIFSNIKKYDRMDISQINDAMDKCDIFILCGGNLLQNETSMRSLIYYEQMIELAKRRGKRVYMISSGFGEIRGKLANFLFRRGVKSCTFCGCRTYTDLNLSKAYNSNSKIMPDLCFLLSYRKSEEKNRTFIWVLSYKERITIDEILDIARHRGLTPIAVNLFRDKDRDVSNSAKSRGINVITPRSYTELTSTLSKADFSISERLHGSIFSIISHIPTYIASDNNKNDALLEEINSRALNSRIILPYSKSNVMAKKEIGAIDSDFNYVLDSLKRDINLALNEIF